MPTNERTSGFRGLLKIAGEFAPGIQDKAVYGEPLNTLKPGALVDYVLQHHHTKRNPKVPHYDFRLGTPESNMFSWAVPKAELPGPGETKPIFQTQLHTHQYNEFEGDIPHGYGAGKVTRADKGKALITKVGPNSISFTLAHQRIPTRYSLVHAGGRDGRTWLLMAKPEPGKVKGVGDKPVYKKIEAVDQDDAIQQATELQAKIDGAHGIINVGEGGSVDAYSVNPRFTGEPIRHTERLGIHGVKVPKKFQGTSLRGEMYYTRDGKAIPFKDVSGVLNQTLAKSIETQRTQGLTPRVALFDTVMDEPRRLRQERLQELMRYLPEETFHTPESATTPEEKERLFQDIKAGRNPLTHEGVMAIMPDESVRKIKNRKEITGFLTGTYPGTGKRKATAGGLTYSLEPGGKTVGRVGSGFSDQDLQDIVSNLESNMGKPIRIEGMGQFGSGKMRAPVYAGFETDKAAAYGLRLPRARVDQLNRQQLLHILDPVNGYADDIALYAKQRLKAMTPVRGEAQGIINRYRKNFGPADHGRATDHTKYAEELIKAAIIKRRGSGYVLLSHKGKVLGHHASRTSALRQERAVQAHKYGSAPITTESLQKAVASLSTKVHSKALSGLIDLAHSISETDPGHPLMMVPQVPTPDVMARGASLLTKKLNLKEVYDQIPKSISSTFKPDQDGHYGLPDDFFGKSGSAPEKIRIQFLTKQGEVKGEAQVEVADTPELRRQGLANRHHLDPNGGMFFDKVGAYWMKGVNYPLDIVFVDPEGTVLEKQSMSIDFNPDAFGHRLYKPGSDKAAHAIELPAGWCDRHGVSAGDTVRAIPQHLLV